MFWGERTCAASEKRGQFDNSGKRVGIAKKVVIEKKLTCVCAWEIRTDGKRGGKKVLLTGIERGK